MAYEIARESSNSSTYLGILVQMETFIVKLRQNENDLLGSEKSRIPLTTVDRRRAFSTLEKRFRGSAPKLRTTLADQKNYTQKHYSWLLYGAAKEGSVTLSPENVEEKIPSGLIDYEPLIVSHAYAVTATEDLINEISLFDEVEDVHPNYVLDLPDLAEGTLAQEIQLQSCDNLWHHAPLGLQTAHQYATGHSVKVAILDTGLDVSHPEFIHLNIAGHAQWDDLGRQMPPVPLIDTHGHGTHVAGILCGTSVGVAPNIDLYVGIAAPSGHATFAQLSKGFDWAARTGVDIVCVSLGKYGPASLLEYEVSQLASQGILAVVAVGNEGPGKVRCPGNCRSSLAVGAVDANNQVWTAYPKGSGGGQVADATASYWKPDVYAPGVDICSCVPHGGYAVKTGTSMATPMVAGIAALVKSRHPNITFPHLVDILKNSSIRIDVPTALGSKGLIVSAAQAVS